MVIHSDSFVGVMLPFLVALAVAVLVVTSAGMLAFGKFRRMAKEDSDGIRGDVHLDS